MEMGGEVETPPSEWGERKTEKQLASIIFSHLPTMASPLLGPKHPSLPPCSFWQMELLIVFEVIGVTLHTRELQAQLQLST